MKTTGAVVYYHGGGFVVSNVRLFQKFISTMAYKLGCIVFSPEYRLAPEYPFPTGVEDSHDATRHVFDNAEMYNIDAVFIRRYRTSV